MYFEYFVICLDEYSHMDIYLDKSLLSYIINRCMSPKLSTTQKKIKIRSEMLQIIAYVTK